MGTPCARTPILAPVAGAVPVVAAFAGRSPAI